MPGLKTPLSNMLTEVLGPEGPGHTVVRIGVGERFFLQGSQAQSIFYLRSGRAKLVVVSKSGKQATVTMLRPGDFFGEEALEESGDPRTTTAI